MFKETKSNYMYSIYNLLQDDGFGNLILIRLSLDEEQTVADFIWEGIFDA